MGNREHELLKTVTATKLATFAINVAAVVYLVYAKRLFGFRGGTKAYEQELRGQSLLEVEASARGGSLDLTGRDVGMSDRSATAAETPAAGQEAGRR